MTGYTPADDGLPLAPEFARLFPPGAPGVGAARPPGGQQQTPRSLVHDAPSTPDGKRPAARTVKPKKPRKQPRKPASTPGAEQREPRSKVQKGK